LIETQQIVGADDDTTDSHTGKLPQCDAPTIQHLDAPKPLLKLLFDFGDSIVQPFVEPAHLKLRYSIEKLLQNSKPSLPEIYIFKSYIIHLGRYPDCLEHNEASHC
jgi:hypothetical protein